MPRFPDTTVPGLLRGVDYACTAVFAVSGAITAAMCGMDAGGVTIVGAITAIGGGTTRDAIILHKQPFWVVEWEYIAMALLAAGITFWVWPHIPCGNVLKSPTGGEGSLMLYLDGLGVAGFAVIGAMNGVRMGVPTLVSVICGVVTATFGGLTRDVLCGLPGAREGVGHGRILHAKADLYATTALIAALGYVSARGMGLSPAGRIIAGVIAGFSARYTAWTHDLRFPVWEQHLQAPGRWGSGRTPRPPIVD